MTIATTSDVITLTMCAGDSIAASTALSFKLGTTTVTNPNAAASYVIRATSYQQGNYASIMDTADTRIAIIDDVVVTAKVDTSFTFTIAGLASGTTVNGTTTSTTTTATAIGFGILQPGIPVIGGQRLTVATNARNGFVVTVQEDQPLTSATGATIDLFKNGATTSVPEAWVQPTGTLDQQWTYGHIGLTSEDTDLNGGEFVGPFCAGNFDNPRQVFSHTGPADGLTANKGTTDVAYEIMVTALQEAGNDYTNTLTYVATPTF